jgi:outer membrane protein insertion porin family
LTSVFRGLGRAIASRKRDYAAILMLTMTSAACIAPAVVGAREARVVSVSVAGNSHVPSDQILAALQTRVGQPFKDETVKADMQTLANSGYFSDQVAPTIRHRPGGGVAVTFNVVENPVVTKVVFRGDTAVTPETLGALMDTAPGNVLNMNTFKQDVVKINAYYDKMGYSWKACMFAMS